MYCSVHCIWFAVAIGSAWLMVVPPVCLIGGLIIGWVEAGVVLAAV